jgi:hypothetical protein
MMTAIMMTTTPIRTPVVAIDRDTQATVTGTTMNGCPTMETQRATEIEEEGVIGNDHGPGAHRCRGLHALLGGRAIRTEPVFQRPLSERGNFPGPAG